VIPDQSGRQGDDPPQAYTAQVRRGLVWDHVQANREPTRQKGAAAVARRPAISAGGFAESGTALRWIAQGQQGWTTGGRVATGARGQRPQRACRLPTLTDAIQRGRQARQRPGDVEQLVEAEQADAEGPEVRPLVALQGNPGRDLQAGLREGLA